VLGTLLDRTVLVKHELAQGNLVRGFPARSGSSEIDTLLLGLLPIVLAAIGCISKEFRRSYGAVSEVIERRFHSMGIAYVSRLDFGLCDQGGLLRTAALPLLLSFLAGDGLAGLHQLNLIAFAFVAVIGGVGIRRILERIRGYFLV